MSKQENDLTDKIKKQHDEIEDQLKNIQLFLKRQKERGNVAMSEVLRQTEVLRDLIVRHFDYEEAQGKLEDFAKDAPQMKKAMDALNREHGKLIDELAAICATARKLADLEERGAADLRSQFNAFLNRLHIHETKELDAIQKAYLTDVGSKD
jgi:hemerythrin-like domain-containing protein